MTAPEAEWARAYRPLRPRSLAIQLAVLIIAEIGLFTTYGVHDARFHWATHFLVALTVTSILFVVGLALTGAPGPRFILLTLLGLHLFAMTPDILFRLGVPHYRWMDVFLGHISTHYIPGGDASWLVIALVATSGYVAVLALWLRARRVEAIAGMPPGVGLTGSAVIRPQRDPRMTLLHADHQGGERRPIVVLIHGLGAASAFWRPVAGRLADHGLRVLSPDLLGFGSSIRLGTHFHLQDQAAAVIRLIESRQCGPVLIAAHSYGAAVAATVAADRSDLVTQLVLVAPAAFVDPDEARQRIGGRNWLARKTLNGSPVADLACGVMCLFRQPLTAAAPHLSRLWSPEVPPDVARGAVAYVWPAYRDALASLLRDNALIEWLRRPRKPTTVVLAMDDQMVRWAAVTSLIDDEVQVEYLPGTHSVPLERPDAVAALIEQAWLRTPSGYEGCET